MMSSFTGQLYLLTGQNAQTLLELVTDLWITIRGFSYASAWIEKFKAENKKSVQKSKGLRKHILTHVYNHNYNSKIYARCYSIRFCIRGFLGMGYTMNQKVHEDS